jgi:hypothetical protein
MILGKISSRDLRIFEDEGIRVISVAKVNGPNFETYGDETAMIYRTKARVLGLVEYKAVIFFDTVLCSPRTATTFSQTNMSL